jgi:hypothetical protein
MKQRSQKRAITRYGYQPPDETLTAKRRAAEERAEQRLLEQEYAL